MSVLERFRKIKLFAFDMDGVLTDGTVWVQESGEQVRRMSIKDGYALQLAVRKGYHVVVISGSFSQPVIQRLNKLGISNVHMNVQDKSKVLQEQVSSLELSMDEVLFMGDDIPDYAVMKMVGMAAAPKDAVDDIKHIAGYVSRYNGGLGCVRDVIETVLKLNNDWQLETEVKSL